MVLFHDFVGQNLRSPVGELTRCFGDGFLLFQGGGASSGGRTSRAGLLDRFREPATVTARLPVTARIVGASPQIIPLTPELERSRRVLIGRGSRTRIRFHEVDVSAAHAALELRPDGWRLRDLDSRNGSWVNGRRIERGGAVRLDGGEELCFGKQARATFHSARTLRLAMSLSCMEFS